MTTKELSQLTNSNVIDFRELKEVNNRGIEITSYHLLIEEGGFWKSYYIPGQKLGIVRQGTPSSNYKNAYKSNPWGIDIRKKMGSRLTELRKEKGLTQEQLATLAQVAPRTVQNVEAGSYSARVDVLEKLANALNCTVDFIKI